MAMRRKNRGTSIMPRAKDDATALNPWDANAWFTEMDRWFDDVRREFERSWGAWPGLLPRAGALPAVRVPALDVRDDGAELVVTAEMPGVSKEDLQVRAMPDRLEVRAEVQRAREEKDEDYVHRERDYSAFERAIPLPAEVVPDKSVANLKDGVLEVRLPKQEPTRQAKPVNVKVQ
jgi:HSP20 family protein